MSSRPKYVYTVQQTTDGTTVGGIGPIMIFGAAHRAVTFGFGHKRDRSKDSERTVDLRRGHMLVARPDGSKHEFVLCQRNIL